VLLRAYHRPAAIDSRSLERHAREHRLPARNLDHLPTPHDLPRPTRFDGSGLLAVRLASDLLERLMPAPPVSQRGRQKKLARWDCWSAESLRRLKRTKSRADEPSQGHFAGVPPWKAGSGLTHKSMTPAPATAWAVGTSAPRSLSIMEAQRHRWRGRYLRSWVHGGTLRHWPLTKAHSDARSGVPRRASSGPCVRRPSPWGSDSPSPHGLPPSCANPRSLPASCAAVH
jgi:hypothetical protein